MNLFATLQRAGGLQALARHLNMSPLSVNAAAEGLLPGLVVGLRSYVRRNGGGMAGVEALLAMFGEFGGGTIAAEVMDAGQFDDATGKLMIARIFGSGTDLPEMLAEAGANSGSDPEQLALILPGLTMLACGYIAARAGGSGTQGSGGPEGLGSLLGDLLGDDPG